MKLKSLLIGSAAAMAVTGAQAADIITVPEPEPVEYVRVCDVYGAGFFYIPGTETCLKISGYVWYQIATGGPDGAIEFDDGEIIENDLVTPGYYGNSEGWVKQSRARLNFDARSETEWGTLRGFIRLQGTWNAVAAGGDGPTTVDQAYIQLGGFMAGYSESFFVDSKNGGPSNYGSHSWGGMYYGYQQRQLIGYRFDGGNGFFGAVSLEDDGLAGDGYMPDVVGKIGISQGWGAAWLVVGYDEERSGFFAPLVPGDGFGIQAGVHLNIPNMPGDSLRILGYYADSDNAYGPGSPLFGWSPEWSILASYNHQFTPNFGVSVAGQYFSDIYVGGTDVSTGVDAWGAELSAVWFPVTNFEVRTEIHYDKIDADEVDGAWSGFLRFTRYFGD